MDNQRMDMNRRDLLRYGAAALAMGMTGIPLGAIAAPDPKLGIPTVTLKWGSLPFTNHCWHVLAARKGFLGDVGITMEGGEVPNTPRIVNERQVIPQLENGELNVSGHYFGGLVQALDRLPHARVFLAYGYAQGRGILCSPTSGYKTTKELLDAGLSWQDATKQAIGQMKGKKLGLLNEPSARPFSEFALSLGGLTFDDLEVVPLEDPKTVQLALGGQLDFAAPSGFVQLYQLQHQSGWKPVIDQPLMMSSMPDNRDRLSEFLNYDLVMTTADFLNNNHDTILRATSALYRTIDYMFGPKQMEALSEYAPFINSVTGAAIDADAIKYIFEELDPFLSFEAQQEIWEDTKSPLYYHNIVDPQLKKLIAEGVLPDQQYDLDTVFAAKAIWTEMRGLKAKTEELKAKFDANTTGERKELYDAALQHYEWRNYLDSARLMQNAVG
jgi:ABC-type nitrate/sulfonate/bicarbonate transport system substrate-binding protein